MKVNRDASNCWKLLLENQYPVDPWTLNEMEKKLVLERFQNEVRFHCMILFRTMLVKHVVFLLTQVKKHITHKNANK